MSCCAPGAEVAVELGGPPSREELLLASRNLRDGTHQTDLSVPGVHCAACIATIEGALRTIEGVAEARVNLSTKRLCVKWRGTTPPPIVEALKTHGYDANLFDAESDGHDPELARLVRALAVAGFAAMNIMLLSVSVWSGADADTRRAFYWISALLAVPALVYSGRIFFASAWSALRRGRTNMDVPISVGVTLAFALSLYDTAIGAPHAYFDAATSLLLFLLIGRTLDHVMRRKARAAVVGLTRLMPRGATVVRADGSHDYVPAPEIQAGMRLAIAPGERIPVDGVVDSGSSDIDSSIVTGESVAKPVSVGAELRSGTLNLTGALTMLATAPADGSFIAEMARLVEAAEDGRARYRRLSDRAARLYSPVVHVTAFATFLGWLAATGDWHHAISAAIAVLIITCPCALGLAVPMVQAVAARRLFEAGIMVKDGSAMERLAEVDTIAFDKTGTLTDGRPRLVESAASDPNAVRIAAAMAARSKHPVSVAIAGLAEGPPLAVEDVRELPGLGLEATIDGQIYRLGRAGPGEERSGRTVLSRDGRRIAAFALEDTLRAGAEPAVQELERAGFEMTILSGDSRDAVTTIAARLGIADAAAGLLPDQKRARFAELAAVGRKVLMVGDGMNDAPALAAAHASMAPASAADIGRNAADFVFLHGNLSAVPLAIRVCRKAAHLIRQTFALAFGYNLVALPVAIAGHVTPLIAALAMSSSSVLVVANALRLRSGYRRTSGVLMPNTPAPVMSSLAQA
jgi:P-type Cu2+ transporter